MPDDETTSNRGLAVAMIVLGILLLVTTALVALLRFPETGPVTGNAALERQETTMRLLVFTGLPGAILLGLGIPLKRLDPAAEGGVA